MFHKLHISGLILVAVAGLAAQPAFAETPSEILASIQKEAAEGSGFQGFFRRARGKILQGEAWW